MLKIRGHGYGIAYGDGVDHGDSLGGGHGFAYIDFANRGNGRGAGFWDIVGGEFIYPANTGGGGRGADSIYITPLLIDDYPVTTAYQSATMQTTGADYA